MKNLADFKKLLAVPGVTVTVLKNDYTKHWKTIPPGYFEPRTVKKVQTNGVCFNTDQSPNGWWYYFPKASCAKAEGDTITFCLKGNGSFEAELVYQVKVPA